jgi:DNA invertase Pin-like site-specific DNA recombinase
MKIVAYYRVSTDRQGRSGLGLDAQREAVSRWAAAHGEIVAEFTEIESGKKNDRPQLAQALAVCKAEKATLVIAKLDRLARNVAFIANLMEGGADFVACDMPHANRLTLHILAAVAEHEREMISKRTKEALAAAKARGVKLGTPSPPTDLSKATAALISQADDFAREVYPLIERKRAEGKSFQAIARELARERVETPRGGRWTATAAKNVLKRNQAATPRTTVP